MMIHIPGTTDVVTFRIILYMFIVLILNLFCVPITSFIKKMAFSNSSLLNIKPSKHQNQAEPQKPDEEISDSVTEKEIERQKKVLEQKMEEFNSWETLLCAEEAKFSALQKQIEQYENFDFEGFLKEMQEKYVDLEKRVTKLEENLSNSKIHPNYLLNLLMELEELNGKFQNLKH